MGQKPEIEVLQRSKGLLVSWHNIELFVVAPARRGLGYAATPAFWNDLESTCWFLLALPFFISYVSVLLDRGGMSLTSRGGWFAMLKFLVLSIGAFFRTFCCGVLPRNGSKGIRYEKYCEGVIGLSGSCCWTLVVSAGLFQLIAEYDADAILGLLAVARAIMIYIGVAEERSRFPINFEDSILYDLSVLEDPGRSDIFQAAVSMCYRDELCDNGSGGAFTRMALDHYRRDRTKLFQVPSLAQQSPFVALLKASDRCSLGPSGVHSGEEKLSIAVVVEEADEDDWDVDGVVIRARAKGSSLRGILRDLQTEFLAVHTKVPAGLVDVVRMASRTIKLEKHLIESDWDSPKTQCKLEVVGGAALAAQHLARR